MLVVVAHRARGERRYRRFETYNVSFVLRPTLFLQSSLPAAIICDFFAFRKIRSIRLFVVIRALGGWYWQRTLFPRKPSVVVAKMLNFQARCLRYLLPASFNIGSISLIRNRLFSFKSINGVRGMCKSRLISMECSIHICRRAGVEVAQVL